MPEPVLSQHDAADLFGEILLKLRARDLAQLATQIEEAAASGVVDEIDRNRLDHLPKSVQAELGTKSVRSRSPLERLTVAVEMLDARLREAPSIAAEAANALAVAPTAIRFEFDNTSVDPSDPGTGEGFSLDQLTYSAEEEELATAALRLLFEGVGLEVHSFDKKPQ